MTASFPDAPTQQTSHAMTRTSTAPPPHDLAAGQHLHKHGVIGLTNKREFAGHASFGVRLSFPNSVLLLRSAWGGEGVEVDVEVDVAREGIGFVGTGVYPNAGMYSVIRTSRADSVLSVVVGRAAHPEV
jgi:hypothetical protein